MSAVPVRRQCSALGIKIRRRILTTQVIENPTTESAIDVIRKSKGKFITVAFVKRTTGEVRRMNCRTGVTKGVTGVGKPFNDYDKGLITVWDAKISQFRSIPLENIITITSQGVVWNYG